MTEGVNGRPRLADVLQVPFALGSFLLFKGVKQAMRVFVDLHRYLNRREQTAWRLVSSEMLDVPLALTVFMTKAPRWNTHAVIGMVGPLVVDSRLEVDAGEADASAGSWSLVIYRSQDRTECMISSTDADGSAPWRSAELRPGRYTLVMRYYDVGESIRLPSIKVDGRVVVEPKVFAVDSGRFYAGLKARCNWFYAALNYYVYTMLRFAMVLPEGFVSSEYLPVGDPGTRFQYGAVPLNAVLRIRLDEEILSAYNVYFTLYDRASFPVHWQRIEGRECLMPPSTQSGYYLIRLRPRVGGRAIPSGHGVGVEVVEPALFRARV